MRNYFLLVILVVVSIEARCQNDCGLGIFEQHKTIKYSVLRWANSIDGLLTYKIQLEDFSKESVSCFLDPGNYDSVMALLKDENTDWQANLILYSLAERDAVQFYGVWILDDKIEFWRSTGKEKDIEFWKEYLKTHKSMR
jgi:hypothetical protein